MENAYSGKEKKISTTNGRYFEQVRWTSQSYELAKVRVFAIPCIGRKGVVNA